MHKRTRPEQPARMFGLDRVASVVRASIKPLPFPLTNLVVQL